MSVRRLLPLLALMALLVAPFGRLAAAEAMAMPRHAMAAMPAHCADAPAPDRRDADRTAIDCMTACAVMTAAAGPDLLPAEPSPQAPEASPLPSRAGISPGADPPPPRFS